jgi:hypothetical protein
VILQNCRRQLFSITIELFFYWKSHGLGPRSHGPGPWFRLMSPRHSRPISTVDFNSGGKDFIKMKGYRRSNPNPRSWPTRRGRRIGPVRQHHRGLAEALPTSSPGHGDAGFLGQNDTGVDGVLTRAKMWQGMAPRRLTEATSLLRALTMVNGRSGTLPASRSSSTPSSWPPLASRPIQWLQSMTFSSNLVAARVWRVSSFAV